MSSNYRQTSSYHIATTPINYISFKERNSFLIYVYSACHKNIEHQYYFCGYMHLKDISEIQYETLFQLSKENFRMEDDFIEIDYSKPRYGGDNPNAIIVSQCRMMVTYV